MRGLRRSLAWVAALSWLLAAAPHADAACRRVAPGGAAAALEGAAPGDTLVLAAGVHRGPLTVRRAVVLRGEPGAIVDGGGRGSVLTIGVAGATVEDLVIRGSGTSVMNIDAGVRVILGERVRLSHLVLTDVLYGVYAERSPQITIDSCDVSGRVQPGNETGEGNGIHLWYCAEPHLTGNRVTHVVDAIYLSFTHGAIVRGNLLHDCGRYGFHTMYCQNGQLIDNRFTRNIAGCAIMFSNHLSLRGNAFVRNKGSRTYGLLLRDCSDGDFLGNRMVANTVGVFMDNSNRNRFRDNLIQDNGWGVLLYSSCADNVFAANDFVQNDYPVALDMRRTDNRFDDGHAGNYWSTHTAYDLDDDGEGDTEYSPVGAFAFLSKQYPDLTLLAKSPAVAALDVAEQMFPALRPSEAVDRHPRIVPVALSADRAPHLPDGRDDPRGAGAGNWPGAAGFAVLALAGGVGLIRGARA